MNTPLLPYGIGRSISLLRSAGRPADVRICIRPVSTRSILALGLGLAAAGGSPLLDAATVTWDGDTDANVATAANWDAVIAANDTLAFGVGGNAGVVDGPVVTALNWDLGTAVNVQFNTGASAYTFSGGPLTWSATGSTITNNSTGQQTFDIAVNRAGNGTLDAAAGSLVFGGALSTVVSSQNGNLTVKGAAGVTFSQTAAVTVARLIVNQGGLLDVNGTTTVSSTNAGDASNSAGVLNVGAGTGSGNGTLNIGSTGSLEVLGTTNSTKQSSIIASSGNTAVVNVNGGSLTIGASSGFIIGNTANGTTGSTGTLNLNSGTVTLTKGSTTTTTNTADTTVVMMGRDHANASGTINLNGGTLATDRQFVRDGSTTAGAGSAYFNFNGGTLKALGAQSDWLRSSATGSFLALTAVTVKAGGAVIDSNGFDVAINNVLAHDTGVTTDGGLTKAGTGTLTLGGVNTYNGATTITAGTLALGVNNAFGSTNFALNGGTLAVGMFTNATVGTLSLTANSTITLGDGGAFAFADSRLLDWGGHTLSISGTFANGFSIRFGTDAGALTGEQLALISINGGAATLDGSGFLVSAIPEPSACAALAGVLTLGAAVWRRRRLRG